MLQFMKDLEVFGLKSIRQKAVTYVYTCILICVIFPFAHFDIIY